MLFLQLIFSYTIWNPSVQIHSWICDLLPDTIWQLVFPQFHVFMLNNIWGWKKGIDSQKLGISQVMGGEGRTPWDPGGKGKNTRESGSKGENLSGGRWKGI